VLTYTQPDVIISIVKEIIQREVLSMRTIVNTVVKTIVVALVLITVSAIPEYIDSHYTREGFVSEVEGDVIIIEDKTGNLWEVESEQLEVGQSVKMKMFNGHTHNTLKDDEIISIKVLTK